MVDEDGRSDAGERTTGAGHGRGRSTGRGEGDRGGGAGRGRGRGAGAPSTNSHASATIGKNKFVTRGIIVNFWFRYLAIYLRCGN